MADSLDRNHCSCNAIVVLIRHHPFDALVNLQGGRQTAGSRTLLCSRGYCQAPEEGRALGTTPPFPIPLVLLIVPSRASLGHNSLPKGHQLEHPVSSTTTSLPPLVPTSPLPSGPMGTCRRVSVSGLPPYLFNESNKGLPVGHPLPLQVLLRGELIAAQLQGDFKAVGVEVIEVLHAWKRRRACGQGNTRLPSLPAPVSQTSWPLSIFHQNHPAFPSLLRRCSLLPP